MCTKTQNSGIGKIKASNLILPKANYKPNTVVAPTSLMMHNMTAVVGPGKMSSSLRLMQLVSSKYQQSFNSPVMAGQPICNRFMAIFNWWTSSLGSYHSDSTAFTLLIFHTPYYLLDI